MDSISPSFFVAVWYGRKKYNVISSQTNLNTGLKLFIVHRPSTSVFAEVHQRTLMTWNNSALIGRYELWVKEH